MKSNAFVSEYIDRRLTQYCNSSLAELKEFATKQGIEISVQHDGFWAHRPGFAQAVQIDIPTTIEDWEAGDIFQEIRLRADELWARCTPKQKLENTPNT